MAAKATLSGRKRTNELEPKVAIDNKADKLLALKKEQSDLLEEVAPIQAKPNPHSKTRLIDAKTIANKIWQQYQRHGKQGSRVQLKYSRQEQHRIVVGAIKEAMLEYAHQLKSQRLPIEEQQQNCQWFVDQVREHLADKGLPVNPLTVLNRQDQ